jgi:type IV pilus assembly protein PilV
MKSFEKGFSLLESIIALMMLAITMLGLVQLFGVAIRQNSFARYNTQAVAVAQQKLEALQTDYNNYLEGVGADLVDGEEEVKLAAPSESGTGSREFVVEWKVAVSGYSREVKVSVSPVVANDFETKTLTMTAVFSP